MPATPQFRRLHFTLRHRIVAFFSEKLFQNFTYTARHGLIQGMKRKGGLGFVPAALISKSQIQAEENFLRGLDFKNKVVYDIGAFQGITTLFFSRQAKRVIAYEPYPANFERLLENVKLNRLQNVTAFNLGLAASEGTIELACDPLMPGAASGDPEIGRQMAGSLAETQTARVPASRLDDEIARHKLPLPDFVKIDIEGMELDALTGMEKMLTARHPQLYMEMHGATDEAKEEKLTGILKFLLRSGYHSILHIESGSTITMVNSSLARSGHIFCVASGPPPAQIP